MNPIIDHFDENAYYVHLWDYLIMDIITIPHKGQWCSQRGTRLKSIPFDSKNCQNREKKKKLQKEVKGGKTEKRRENRKKWEKLGRNAQN